MTYIYFTKSLRELDIAGLADFARQSGIDGIDMAIRPGYPIDPASAANRLPGAVKQLADAGIKLPLASAPTSLRDPVNNDAVRIFHACAAAGVSYVKIGYFPYTGQFAADFSKAQAALDGFAKLAEKTGVRALHHTHSGSNIGSNLESQGRLLERCDPHWVGCYADPGHQAVNGGPFHMALNYASKWFAALAIKDMLVAKQKDGAKRTVVPVGEGIVAWRDVRQAVVVDRKFDGIVSLHGEYEAASLDDRIQKAKQELVKLKDLFR